MAQSVDSFNDLAELGIDLESTNDSLTKAFDKAAQHLQTLLPNVDSQTLLLVYGYYKQATEGPCNTPKPSWYDLRAKSKWEAWSKLGRMPSSDAKTRYINTVKDLDPKFDATGTVNNKESWVSVSVLDNNQVISESDKTIFDHVKEDDPEKVLKALKNPAGGINKINDLDEDGMGLIHWAADRGSLDVLKVLLDSGAQVNLQDSDGQTALHYASSCGHVGCIKLLLSKNASKDILDNDGLSANDVACDDAVKELLLS